MQDGHQLFDPVSSSFTHILTDPVTRDALMIDADGSPNKGKLGANASLGCSLAIARGWAPGTVNLQTVDPRVSAELPHILDRPLEADIRTVLSTSFGFGGLNAALVFARP